MGVHKRASPACEPPYPTFLRSYEKRLYNTPDGAVAELADAADLKSAGGDTVRVRPPLAPHKSVIAISSPFFGEPPVFFRRRGNPLLDR